MFNERTGIVIQARMASSRLPGKVLMGMPFGSNETMLSQIFKSLEPLGGQMILATSINPENDVLENYCNSRGVKCFRGSENDVLSRFCQIQNKHNFQHIFRFTADNPLIDIDKLLLFFETYKKRELDYAYSTGMPLGMNFEVFSGEILEKLPLNDLTSEEKEHVTLFIKRNEKFKTGFLKLSDYSGFRMTVDTPIDYAQLSLVFQVKENNGLTGLQLVERIQESYKWILELNRGVLQSNNFTDSSKEIIAAVEFLEDKGYYSAAKKLLE